MESRTIIGNGREPGGGTVSDHNLLSNRNIANQHIIGAITPFTLAEINAQLTSGDLDLDSDPRTDPDAVHTTEAGEINAVTAKGSPVDADLLLIEDSENAYDKRKILISNLPTGADSDAIHDNVADEINQITEKTTPAKADVMIIEDSADSLNKKKVQLGNLPGDKLQFNTAYTPTSDPEGEVRYNPDEGTLDICGPGGSVIQAGFEDVTKVYNQSGATIPNGSVVTLGQAVGGYPTITLARADTFETASALRVTTQDITNLSHGRVTLRGKVRGIDTSGFIEGVPLWLSATVAGGLTNTRPAFPNYSLFIGVATTVNATTGVIDVELGSDLRDTFDNFWNGTFREPFKFNVTSNGTAITGTLIPRNGHPDMTMIFSSGFATLDTSPGATVQLTAGDDDNPQTNYVYVLESDSPRVLVASTSDWPAEEHIKVAEVVVQSASTVGTNGALRNQNWNDEIQDTVTDFFQGHLSHIGERIRQEPAKWSSGTQGGLTGLPSNVYVTTTSGKVYQMHKQTFPAFDTSGTDLVQVVNGATAYTTVSDLNGQQTDAEGGSLTNKYFSFVLWGVISSAGDKSHIMINLPTGSYNSAASAEDDALGYSVYDIPKQFQGVGFLIARFNLYLNAAGTSWTLNSTQDLRGFVPNTTAGGGGGGGGGSTTFLGLTDTFNSYAGLANQGVRVNAAETALEADGVNSAAHASRHQDGGADEINVGGLSGVLADPQDPATHGESAHSGTIGTASQVGLGNVTNDAQLKRSANDWAGFTEETGPAAADLILIEDASDSGNKKKVQLTNLEATDPTAIHTDQSGEINGITTEETSPQSTDLLVLEDASNSYAKRKVQIGNLPAGSATDPNAIHKNTAAEISTITEKTTPVDADLIVIEDSANSYNKKKVQIQNLPSGGGSDLPLDSTVGSNSAVVTPVAPAGFAGYYTPLWVGDAGNKVTSVPIKSISGSSNFKSGVNYGGNIKSLIFVAGGQINTNKTVTCTNSAWLTNGVEATGILIDPTYTKGHSLKAFQIGGTTNPGIYRIAANPTASSITLDAKWNTTAYTIDSVNQGTKTFTISGDGDLSTLFANLPFDHIDITGSTGNDGRYTVSSYNYSSPDFNIVVSESIPSATADGTTTPEGWDTNFSLASESRSSFSIVGPEWYIEPLETGTYEVAYSLAVRALDIDLSGVGGVVIQANAHSDMFGGGDIAGTFTVCSIYDDDATGGNGVSLSALTIPPVAYNFSQAGARLTIRVKILSGDDDAEIVYNENGTLVSMKAVE